MKIEFYDLSGNLIEKKIKKLKWINLEYKKEYEHYMIKEIYDQILVSKILIDSLNTEQEKTINDFIEKINDSKKIVFVAAGSSYHASLIGSKLFRELNYDAYSVLASEYKEMKYDRDTLVIAVSQSGETMDVILALKDLKSRVKDILSIVNVPYSTIQRMSSNSIEIKAGQEKCVAATKTFTNQVITFFYIANKLGLKINLYDIPKEIENTIKNNEEKVINLSKYLKNEKDLYIIGRGINYYSSMEIALKLKEISYIHAEALPGGELKHGTLALIEEGTKVLSLNPYWDDNIKTNIEEILARGGSVYKIPGDFNISESFPDFTIYSVIIGQLLTYYIAREKRLPIDYPRNLAKSVTVK
ncbi:MAG: SIS domain-containing protein [Nanopusillaceae archaeon]